MFETWICGSLFIKISSNLLLRFLLFLSIGFIVLDIWMEKIEFCIKRIHWLIWINANSAKKTAIKSHFSLDLDFLRRSLEIRELFPVLSNLGLLQKSERLPNANNPNLNRPRLDHSQRILQTFGTQWFVHWIKKIVLSNWFWAEFTFL